LSYAGKKTVSLLHKLRFRVHLRLIHNLCVSTPDPEPMSNYAGFKTYICLHLIRSLCLSTPDSIRIVSISWRKRYVNQAPARRILHHLSGTCLRSPIKISHLE